MADPAVNLVAGAATILDMSTGVKGVPQTKSPYLTAVINTSTSGDNALVAAVAGKTVRVYRIVATLAAGTVTFKDDSIAALSGPLAANAMVLEDPLGNPLYVTSPGNAFTANLSGANQFSGTIWYTQS